MTEWTDQQRRSVLSFFRRASAATGSLAEEARSLLRWLDPPTKLPPEHELDRETGNWVEAENRYYRRKALVAQLMRAPGHRLRASEISLPGVTSRTALSRWLSAQVRCGFLKRTEGRIARNRFATYYYSIAEPAPK